MSWNEERLVKGLFGAREHSHHNRHAQPSSKGGGQAKTESRDELVRKWFLDSPGPRASGARTPFGGVENSLFNTPQGLRDKAAGKRTILKWTNSHAKLLQYAKPLSIPSETPFKTYADCSSSQPGFERGPLTAPGLMTGLALARQEPQNASPHEDTTKNATTTAKLPRSHAPLRRSCRKSRRSDPPSTLSVILPFNWSGFCRGDSPSFVLTNGIP
ncbi:hypothetical protein P7K49_022874 [Saguinus oedipus]|uniref:Uncharacterized protein n=1 Tax=Saguinus oedipus TaxID=9490 RepID=A0ABQ9UK57_SAGOE|nr:hypothetical protein P7K49_022874 [Saguinus oedipus]